MRIGLGEDSHMFGGENKLVLGGVVFEGEKGLKANSDGDVILHSLCNAISSSIGKGSLGEYADKMCKDGITDSKEYLKKAYSFVKEKGYDLENISISIEAKVPKILGKEEQMKKIISDVLAIQPDQVGITSTSGEELTVFGKGEGVKATSIVCIKKC